MENLYGPGAIANARTGMDRPPWRQSNPQQVKPLLKPRLDTIGLFRPIEKEQVQAFRSSDRESVRSNATAVMQLFEAARLGLLSAAQSFRSGRRGIMKAAGADDSNRSA
jgi:hypothetical protein